MAQRKFDETGGAIQNVDRKIRWLASYPKSGNTWVRMFLEAYATKCEPDLNSAYRFVTSDLRSELFQMMMPRPVTELTLLEQFMYHAGAMLNLIKLSGIKDAYVKTHNAKAIVDGYQLIPPQISGKSIYIMRDPRDVVISMSEHFSKDIDESIKDLADTTRAGRTVAFGLHHMFMDWSSHVRSWGKENKNVPTLLIKYEDMLKKPVNAFRVILEQFDIEYEEQRFDFAFKETVFEKLQKKEGVTGFIEKAGGDRFFRVGKAGQWKTVLSKSQIDQIESDHKEVMKTYGYL
jgi:hypothetical protein